MYKVDDFNKFVNPETRLKQLLLKLKEQEESNAKLKSAVKASRQEMTIQSRAVLNQAQAMKVNNNLGNIIRDINQSAF